MTHNIQRTNRITKETTYYCGNNKWTSVMADRKIYNTEDEANSDNPSEFPGTATAE